MAEVTHTIPLASQVGGHAGVLTSDDGSLLIKPALPLEHKFYQYLTSDPVFAPLRPFTPKFLGTLKLEGKATESDQGIEVAQVTDVGVQKDKSNAHLKKRLFIVIYCKHSPLCWRTCPTPSRSQISSTSSLEPSSMMSRLHLRRLSACSKPPGTLPLWNLVFV